MVRKIYDGQIPPIHLLVFGPNVTVHFASVDFLEDIFVKLNPNTSKNPMI